MKYINTIAVFIHGSTNGFRLSSLPALIVVKARTQKK
jgi:hypothetical protein